jgi:hypothetical protein
MLPASFDPFVKAAPFCVLARAALEALFRPQRLNELFRRTAQHQYTRELLFSQLVELMIAVVLRQQPSVYAAYRNKVANITVSHQALYDKLDQLELGVSAALVRDSACHIAPVIDELGARRAAWLADRRVKIIDGNALSATEHRLSELRDTWDAPMPGKVLAVFDPQTELTIDVFLTPDGHAQEASLLGEVLATVEADDVWIADRNFCTLSLLCGIDARAAGFVIRQHGRLQGRLLGERRLIGRCETGDVYEQRIEVDRQGQVSTWRRVSVALDVPTRDGDQEIHILTNLPPETADGPCVAGLYRKRWTIEGLFYEVTQTLNCEPDTLAYPPAALFAFCLSLVASNAVSLCKASMRATAGADAVEQLSVYYVALEIQQTHKGMAVALPAESWQFVRELSPAELSQLLRHVASVIDPMRYRKSTRGPKKPPPKRTPYNNGGHTSTHKLLQKRKPEAP